MKETLEEACTNYANESMPSKDKKDDVYWYGSWLGFRKGAQWQAERMYSEEDVIKIVEKSRRTGLTVEYLLLTLKQ